MTIGGRGMAANANFGTCGNGGNDNGNDGGKWESTFAAPIVAVIVILVVVKVVIIISVVIAVIVIIPDSVITSAAVILVVPVVSVVATLTKSSLPSVIVAVRFNENPGGEDCGSPTTKSAWYGWCCKLFYLQRHNLITLPPVSELTTPLFITLDRDFSRSASEFRIIESNHALFVVGDPQSSPPGFSLNLTATITEGSEDFVSVATTLTTGTTRMTAADVITESGMMTMTAMTTEIMMTTFTTTRITITATIGAAKVDSHLPPSFPLSFPPFPQVPKLALAAIPRPPIVIPAPAYARADNGGNQLAAGRRILMAQSAI